MVMDYLRSGYKGIIRPWADSDDTVAIRWYRALPGAKEFPLPSAFCSVVWDTYAGSDTPVVGEITRTQEWRSTNLKHAPPGQEFHGLADWWINGIPAAHRNDPPPNCYWPCLETDPRGDDLYPEQGIECLQPDLGQGN